MNKPKRGSDDMFPPEQLEQMRNIDITKVDKASLVDIETIHVDASAPFEERARQYFEQVKNPYAVRVGEYAVKFEYMQNGRTLRDALASYLTMIKNQL